MKTHPPLPIIGLIPLLAACSESSMFNEAARSADWDTGHSASEGGDWDDGAGGDGGGGGDDWEPEQEDDFLSLRPAPTDAYVFVANPARDTVTRISVPSLAVITTGVGNEPHVVATTDDYEKAVTFNRGSDDVTIIDADTLETRSIAVRENFNAMEMSPDGAWVACWYDAATAKKK